MAQPAMGSARSKGTGEKLTQSSQCRKNGIKTIVPVNDMIELNKPLEFFIPRY